LLSRFYIIIQAGHTKAKRPGAENDEIKEPAGPPRSRFYGTGPVPVRLVAVEEKRLADESPVWIEVAEGVGEVITRNNPTGDAVGSLVSPVRMRSLPQ
jgi:hypothetical protein